MRLFIKVLITTLLIPSALYFFKVALGKYAHVSTLLLYSNFVSPFVVCNDFYLWYVDCMLQILLLLWLCHKLASIARSSRLTAFSFTIGVFGIACALKLALPTLMFEDFFQRPPSDHHVANYMLSTHWPTFALGAAIAVARGKWQRMLAAALIVIYATVTGLFYYSVAWAFIMAAGLLLMFIPRVPIWRPFSRIVFALSGASLFIYLTHLKYFVLYHSLGMPIAPWLQTALALTGGVATWWLWLRLWGFVTARFGAAARMRQVKDLATV